MDAGLAPVEALSSGSPPFGSDARVLVLEGMLTAAAALAIVAFAVAAHTLHPAFAVTATVFLAAAAFRQAPSLALAAVVASAVFQNLFVSLASPAVSPGTDFVLIRGYNFLTLATVWVLAWFSHLLVYRGRSAEADRLILVTSGAFGLVLFYLAVGLPGSPQSAVIYFRNIATGLMMYQAALILARNHPLRLGTVLAILAGLLAALGYVELLFRGEWLTWTNGYAFWDLAMADEKAAGLWDRQVRETGIVVLGLQDSFTIALFNTPLLADWGIRVARLFGPNMHAISYAYALAFFVIYTLFTGRLVLAGLLLPLLLFANAKGALVVVLMAAAGWFLARWLGSKLAFAVLTVVLVIYAAAGVAVGLRIGDYHALGLMGGVHNFIDFPFGHGLGAGGNLAMDFTTLSWSDFQAAGRTPVAMESAVGVLLYQMGFAAFAFLACYAWLAWKTVAMAGETGDALHAAAGFALLAIVFNGLFQEEALFSPLAVGLSLALCGLIHGAFLRQQPDRDARASSW